VQYTSESIATAAMGAMDGFDLAGRQLRVSWAQAQPRPTVPYAAPGGGGGGGGGAIDIQAALAAALGQAGPALGVGVAAAPAAAETKCVLLRNLVSPEEVSDPGLRGEVMEETSKHGAVEQLEIIVHQARGRFFVDASCVKARVYSVMIAGMRVVQLACAKARMRDERASPC
jgi:hypothetical protein